MHSNANRFCAPIQVLGRAAQRIESIFVVAVRFSRKIVSQEALYWMVPCANVNILCRIRDYGTKYFKSRHHVAVLLSWIGAFHCESEQASFCFCVSHNRERDGVRPADSKRLESVRQLRLKAHCFSFSTRLSMEPTPFRLRLHFAFPCCRGSST